MRHWLLAVSLLFALALAAQNAAAPDPDQPLHLGEIVIPIAAPQGPAEVEAARQQAKELYDQILAGANFAEMAKAHSSGRTARSGGEVSIFADTLDPKLQVALDGLRPGQVTEPVQTKQGFVILKLPSQATTDCGSALEPVSGTYPPDFNAYLSGMRARIYQNWFAVIPESAMAPARKSGMAVVSFSIARKGDLRDIKIAQSAGDVALDRAAYAAVSSSNPLAPLPTDVSEPITMRARFCYNPQLPGNQAGKKKKH